MARPTKQGLDYFSLDINLDTKFKLFEAENGLIGFAIIIKLFQKIYDNGYFCEWNEDEQLLFSNELNVDINSINVYINSALKRNIFNLELFEKYNILTSRGIQKRFLEACKRRKQIEIIKSYFLVDINSQEYKDFKEKIVFVDINSINVYINTENVNINSQSKVKESKVKEKEIKAEENNLADDATENSEKELYNKDKANIEKVFIETIGSTNLNNIKECMSYLDKLPKEVIEYALKKTARSGAKWNYAITVLESYIEKGLNSLEKIEANEIEFKNKVKQTIENEEEKNKQKIKEMEAIVNGNKGFC